MSWDEGRFEELERQVLATLRGKYTPPDVPFFRFLYGPGDGVEHTCLSEFKRMVHRINHIEGFSAECIYLSNLLIESLGALGFLDNDVLRKEDKDRSTLRKDLGSNLPREVSARLTDLLKDKDRRHCAVLLRLGSLFPFVRISHILQRIDSILDCVLVIPYPGSKEGEMLWHRGIDGNSYYRWQTV